MPIIRKVRKLGGRPAFGAAARETSSLRPEFVEKAAPCFLGCPNGTDVRGVLTTLALGEARHLSPDAAAEAAFHLLTARNPLPASCGWLCPHHCEDDCNRGGYDEAIAVNAIERAIGQNAIERALPLLIDGVERRAERMAVLGAGAAGLSAAWGLVRLGYGVTVFHDGPEPGGELLAAAEQGLVPAAVVKAEIARLGAAGVEFAGGSPAPGENFARVIRTKAQPAGRFVAAALAAAIHYGRHAAELADADLRGVPLPVGARRPRATREQIKFHHHSHAPRAAVAGRTLSVEEAIAEARRCLACGGCLECDNCWKYCPDQAVLKPLERGEPYRFRLEFCQGCSKCAEECPTGYIEMR